MSSPKGHSKACWNAKGKVCKCKCHKKFHGLGRKNPQELGEVKEKEAEEWLQSYGKEESNINEIIKKDAPYTLEEFF